MRICLIGQKGVPAHFGGIETHVAELGSRLAKAGNTVFAYARTWYTPKGETLFDGVRIVRLPSLYTKHLDAASHTFIAVLHALFVVRPDVYHFHGVGPSLFAWIPRLFAPSATVIATFHCIDRKHGKWGVFARFSLRLGEWCTVKFADETIVVGKTLQEYVHETYGVLATYLPNGITPRRAVVDARLVTPFGLEPTDYILMVSRLVPHKRVHTLISAWQKARALRPDLLGPMKLAIAGDGAFTDAYVKSLHLQAAADPSVVFTGFQRGDTLEGLFMGSRFVVHPSASEGLPIALLEAMSYGKAVLASDIPENREVVEGHGELVALDDVNGFAEAIIALVEDPMTAASYGHTGRTFVEEQFHWDYLAPKVEEVYRRNLPGLRMNTDLRLIHTD